MTALKLKVAPRQSLSVRVYPTFQTSENARAAAESAATAEAVCRDLRDQTTVQATAASGSATAAATSATAASTSATAAAGSATAAANSATAAATSATNAASSATSAGTSATNAANSATAAATSATNAATSATSAATSATSALAAISGAIRSDIVQSLGSPAQAQAQANIGLQPGTTAGKVVVLDAAGKLPALDGSQLTGIAGGGPSFRNRIINGNFAVNQRVVSGTVTLAANAYGHDRWKAGAGGCTYTFATSGLDTTITITSGTLLQVIEGAGIEGGVYVASWSGTAQARVYQGAASGTYAASGFATASLTAATNTTIEFGTGTLTRVQLEPGALVTAFERRDDELRRCQRYYQRVFFGLLLAATGGVNHGAYILFPVPMRSAPTASASASANTNAGSTTIDSISSVRLRFYANVTATGGAEIVCDTNLSAEL